MIRNKGDWRSKLDIVDTYLEAFLKGTCIREAPELREARWDGEMIYHIHLQADDNTFDFIRILKDNLIAYSAEVVFLHSFDYHWQTLNCRISIRPSGASEGFDIKLRVLFSKGWRW